VSATRIECDLLGSREVAVDGLYGIHTLRSLENFPLTGRSVHQALARAYGAVKLACARTNVSIGCWLDDAAKAAAIDQACAELGSGALDAHLVVDALAGGAGTSVNMNVNEVLANRALEILGLPHGAYDRVSPLDDINLHQSTNDTYPTALRLAAIRRLHSLEERVIGLQQAFQAAEQRFAGIVKVGRTEMQEAVLITLGREMGAYAEALGRDRWRIYKCEERLRVVNLGGTAIGTGLAAPRQYVFRVVDELRAITGVGFARAENLVEATQNADTFVEVSGILKALAATLWKISGDLRTLSSFTREIRLPERQAGSSIMPGKVNPVIPEAVTQCAMLVFGYDASLGMACAAGNLELNPFLPLVANCLLESLDLLTNACDILRCHCVEGISADEEHCRETVGASTAIATALVPAIGYERACAIVRNARESGNSVGEAAVRTGLVTRDDLDRLTHAELVCRLGSE
jgi:aspartate ammonia-lyase